MDSTIEQTSSPGKRQARRPATSSTRKRKQRPARPGATPAAGASGENTAATTHTAEATPEQDVATAMARVEAVTGEHFRDVLDAVKAAIAVAAVGCLTDNTQPTTLIFVAPASAGKSMALGFLTPANDQDPLAPYFYRSDKFTAASFVSHRADLNHQQLAQVDMLPRLKGRTLVTKELAPLFSGKREELTERFSILTAVLDGQGFVSDSGAQGRRGYTQPINFQWLGATTPLSPEVLAVMAQLGPRMLFYDADRPRKDTEALVALARRGDGEEAKRACGAAVRALLVALFKRYPTASVRGDSLALVEAQLRGIVLWADALVRLRATVRDTDFDDEAAVEAIEHPERVLGLLKNIAIGSALVHGRAAVEDYDLAQVAHIALSSGVPGRQRVLQAVLAAGGIATTPQIMERAGVSHPTALRYMQELAVVGLARFTEGSPASVELVEPYAELCMAPLLKAKRGEGGRLC